MFLFSVVWSDNSESDVCDRADAICTRGNLQFNVTDEDEDSEFACLVQYGNNRKPKLSAIAELLVLAKGISIMSIFVIYKLLVFGINHENSGCEETYCLQIGLFEDFAELIWFRYLSGIHIVYYEFIWELIWSNVPV